MLSPTRRAVGKRQPNCVMKVAYPQAMSRCSPAVGGDTRSVARHAHASHVLVWLAWRAAEDCRSRCRMMGWGSIGVNSRTEAVAVALRSGLLPDGTDEADEHSGYTRRSSIRIPHSAFRIR